MYVFGFSSRHLLYFHSFGQQGNLLTFFSDSPPAAFGDKRYISERTQVNNDRLDLGNVYLQHPKAALAVASLQQPSVTSWKQACVLHFLRHDGFTSGWVSGNAFSRVRSLIRLTYFWDPNYPDRLPTFAFELHGWYRAMGGRYEGDYVVGVRERQRKVFNRFLILNQLPIFF
jgi:hypothetical protein